MLMSCSDEIISHRIHIPAIAHSREILLGLRFWLWLLFLRFRFLVVRFGFLVVRFGFRFGLRFGLRLRFALRLWFRLRLRFRLRFRLGLGFTFWRQRKPSR